MEFPKLGTNISFLLEDHLHSGSTRNVNARIISRSGLFLKCLDLDDPSLEYRIFYDKNFIVIGDVG
tara:strand:- start:940 stop:1137 length:198 start_codon:yes stop_codon:yes gene_type:complete